MSSPIRNESSSSGSMSLLQRAMEFKENIGDKIKEGVGAALEVKEAVVDGFEAAKEVAEHGYKAAKSKLGEEALREITNPTGKLNLLGKAKLVGGAASAVVSVAKLPVALATSYKEIREGFEKGIGTDEGKSTALKGAREGLEALKDTAEDVRDGAASIVGLNKLRTTYKAAETAFKAVVPGASAAVVKSAAKAAAKSVFEGATGVGKVAKSVEAAAMTTAKEVGAAMGASKGLANAVGIGERAVAKATIRAGSKAAGEAALHAAAEAGGKGLAKAAGRFAPGLNIAIAALDTANAVATLADPKASTGSKVCSCITAVGSIAAATNIPVVSQVGAAVSVVSSFVSSFF